MAIKTRKRVPALTTDQMREVDRIMVEDLHIELVQMMENAGRSLAELAVARFSPAIVVVLAGPGGNGGGGMVAAEHRGSIWSAIARAYAVSASSTAASRTSGS